MRASTRSLVLLTGVAAVAALLLIMFTAASHAATKPTVAASVKTATAEAIVETWTCQDQRGIPRSHARSPWKPHSPGFRAEQLNLWKTKRAMCIEALHRYDRALREGRLHDLTTRELYTAARHEIQRGGIYSIGWGAASPLLRGLCYEAVDRAFSRYGTQGWARYIVNRESGCNPGAQNTTYAACTRWSTCQRATGLSQMIPAVHSWVDYDRVTRDLRYAVQVFIRLSNGGTRTGPWSTY